MGTHGLISGITEPFRGLAGHTYIYVYNHLKCEAWGEGPQDRNIGEPPNSSRLLVYSVTQWPKTTMAWPVFDLAGAIEGVGLPRMIARGVMV